MRPTRGGATTAACLDDIVAGHLAALDRGAPKRAYILGGWTGSFHALFSLAAEVVGAPEPAYISPAVVRAFAGAQEMKSWFTGVEPRVTRALVRVAQKNRQYSSERAIAELGYTPGPLRAGMEAALQWAKAQGRWP
jgi:dihydroflavonol-4-reductase